MRFQGGKRFACLNLLDFRVFTYLEMRVFACLSERDLLSYDLGLLVPSNFVRWKLEGKARGQGGKETETRKRKEAEV